MTIRRADVARLAGTSPSVVSYVINNGPRNVAPETRKRVEDAIRQLNYKPNHIARSLRLDSTMTLGLIVPDVSNPYFSELHRAIEKEAFRRGYTMLVGNSDESAEHETAYLQTFAAMQIDGLCIVPANESQSDPLSLQEFDKPCVILDRRFSDSTLPTVGVDNFTGAHEATTHLLEHGRRAIGCVAGPAGQFPATKRVAGWEAALQEHGLPVSAGQVVWGGFGRYAGYTATQTLLDQFPDCDAIFVTNDEQAIGSLKALRERGLRCPEDVSLVSFDGIDPADYSVPSLTTMAQPFEELASCALAILLDGSPSAPGNDRGASDGNSEPAAVLPTSLVLRQSCGCVPIS